MRTSERVTYTGLTCHQGFDVNNEVFLNKIKQRKKRKKESKSEIIQKPYVFSVRMPKVSQNAESVEKKEEATKSQQQRAGPGA